MKCVAKFVHEGKEYQVAELDYRSDVDLIQKEFLRLRKSPLVEVLKLKGKIPEDEYDKVYDRAYRDTVNTDKVNPKDVFDWIETLEGIEFVTWLATTKFHPEFPRENMRAALINMSEAEKERLLAVQSMTTPKSEREAAVN